MVKIGLVIPTAFNRPEYLPLAYGSIANQTGDFELEVLVGCPGSKVAAVQAALPKGVKVVPESEKPGLALKLDDLLKQLSPDCDYIAWLGDDDILVAGSLQEAYCVLKQNPTAAMVYGGCDYIDADGKVIFTNTSGAWAARILNFGPQLIPQPGSLMRRTAFLASGGLSNRFSLAFDFDLFIKLKRQGPLLYSPSTLAQFRWHPESLSVRKRLTSALEASRVRRSHYRGLARLFWVIWEPFVIAATWLAGKLVSVRPKALLK